MKKPTGEGSTLPQGYLELIRMSVTQDRDGNCTVIEHDLHLQRQRAIAKFPADQRREEVVFEGEADVLIHDLAAMRAGIFARTYEQIVNTGMVPWPSVKS
jgi:hypothetical protein